MQLGCKPVHLGGGRNFENKLLLDNNALFCHKKYSYYNQRNKTEGILGSFICFYSSKPNTLFLY